MEKKSWAVGGKENCVIVGVGVSGGSMAALRRFLTALPAETGAAYVVVQHVMPDVTRVLTETLPDYTSMPVVYAEDNMPLEPDRVYVIPHGRSMCISRGRLFFDARSAERENMPISRFFRSLADQAGRYAVGVVLSGTGMDGSGGIKAIKENDGLTFAQEPDSAEYGSMPENAISTGAVDAELTPEKIAAEVAAIARVYSEGGIVEMGNGSAILGEDQMSAVLAILRGVSNIDFSQYKGELLTRRIERRMLLTHSKTVGEYIELLRWGAEEPKALKKELLMGTTGFFREPDCFSALGKEAIQSILRDSDPRQPVRVWVPGCATGEEAYSIATLFCEEMETMMLHRDVKIFATDVNAEGVETASRGRYNACIADSIPEPVLKRYFVRSGGGYAVSSELRRMVVFSEHNVFQDPPFGRLDLISCRNLMIYLRLPLQNALLEIFHSVLREGGYLFLGVSEAVGAHTEAFPTVDSAAKIFTHNRRVDYAGSGRKPFLRPAFHLDELYDPCGTEEADKEHVSSEKGSAVSESVDRRVLESYLPACIVVDGDNNIVRSYGNCSNCTHIPRGEFDSGLSGVLTEALKIPAATALQEARASGQPVRYKVAFTGEVREETVALCAEPLAGGGRSDGLYVLVLKSLKSEENGDVELFPWEDGVRKYIAGLEQELEHTQKALVTGETEQKNMRERLRLTNDKLLVSNETLLTMNEELQSANEGLQSVNEELYTVNDEFQRKLTELTELSDDIANFLASSLVGIIFVDRRLNLRRYTDYISSEFAVLPRDVGKPLTFMDSHFPSIDIASVCFKVMKTLKPYENEAADIGGRTFLIRVIPYRSMERSVLGCVITLVDITEQRDDRKKCQEAEEKLERAIRAKDAGSERAAAIADRITEQLERLRLKAEQLEDDGLEDVYNTLSRLVRAYSENIIVCRE